MVKKEIKKLFNIFGIDIKRNRPYGISKFSIFNEDNIIQNYISSLHMKDKYCVEIGANDGISMSNTYSLFKKGWEGLVIEYDSINFSKLAYFYRGFSGVNLLRCKITPVNVISTLQASEVPKKIGFLNLDIDGYDYYVLEKLLDSYRPSLICTEINEKIPPPIKFTVNYDPDYAWAGDHFFGQSISQLFLLCQKFDYSLVELEYANAFLIPQEINPYPSLSAKEAYEKGYLNRLDRKTKFPHNDDFEIILKMPSDKAHQFLMNYFLKYEGKFKCII